MDGERISLRLEPEDLELLDAFIDRHPEYSNRSNLARVAIRQFIEQLDGDRKTEATKHAIKKNVVTVEVPRLAHETIMDLVRIGEFNSAEDAVVDCIRRKYLSTEDILEAVKRAKIDAIKNTVQVVSE